MRSMPLRVMVVALLVNLAAPALAQEEPMPAPPEGTPQPPPAPPQPAPYPVQPRQPMPPPQPLPPPGYAPQPYPVYPVPVRVEPNRTAQRVALYFELLGKGVFWGIGGDVNIISWLGLGAVYSYWSFLGWFRTHIISPYVSFYPVGGQRSSMVIHAGPQIWIAEKSENFWIWKEGGALVLGQVSVGWEWRHHFLFRAMLTGIFNQYGFIPWPGFSFGGAF